VLERATVRGAVAPSGATAFDRMLLVPMRYSAGLMLGNSPVGLYGPLCRNAFGHLGLINIFCWADPDRDLAVSLLSTGKSLYGTHLIALTALLNSIGWRTLV
jgi:CubicO group peptidase (beta-lactamase class C family)